MATRADQPRIPPMNDLLRQGVERGLDRFGRPALREALNQSLDRLREGWRTGSSPPETGEAFWAGVEAHLAVTPALRLRRALNATGVVLHTGLGRSPWPPEAMAAAVAAARSAVLEVDRESGGRGRRDAAVAARLGALTGAEDGLAVNNNAAAVLLALAALARGRKVVLSRGEMVEIGGSYRLPEVVAAAGATLVEVGTTNQTRCEDYLAALEDPEVGCVLKVHPSNFRQAGFTGSAGIAALQEPCRERGVALVYDLGSGVLAGADMPGLSEEPTVRDALRAGAGLVTFSGDKLLGGPQAGLVAGAAALVGRLRRDVLARCLRLDKTLLAALEAVLALHALGPEAAQERLPALRMIAAGRGALRERAAAFAGRLAQAGLDLDAEAVDTEGRVGSGAAPEVPLPGAGLALSAPGLDAGGLARALRTGEPPVFARVQGGRVVLDFRTLAPAEEDSLLDALAGVRCAPGRD